MLLYSRLSCLIMGLMWSNQTCGGRNTTRRGFEGAHRSSDSEDIFTPPPISPSSSDGSGTPGQSSPPPRGSCGSTPGPTAPCPRLFAVDGEKKKKTESEHSGLDAWFSDSIHVNGDHQINQSRPLWWQRRHPVSPIAGDQSVASFTPEFKSQASPKTWLVCQTRERRFTAV